MKRFNLEDGMKTFLSIIAVFLLCGIGVPLLLKWTLFWFKVFGLQD